MGLDWNAVRRRVDALELEPGDWLLFGSVPMLAHGLIPEVGDVDILARGRAWEQAQAMAAPVSGRAGDSIVRLPDDIEIFDGWPGGHADGFFERADRVDEILVASLADVLAFKRSLGRPKDAGHIAILEQTIEA